MRKKLYGNRIQPTCEICLYGRRSSDGGVILCTFRGIKQLYSHCRRFSYDPLKRVPFRQPKVEEFTPEDFSIEP